MRLFIEKCSIVVLSVHALNNGHKIDCIFPSRCLDLSKLQTLYAYLFKILSDAFSHHVVLTLFGGLVAALVYGIIEPFLSKFIVPKKAYEKHA